MKKPVYTNTGLGFTTEVSGGVDVLRDVKIHIQGEIFTLGEWTFNGRPIQEKHSFHTFLKKHGIKL